MNPAIFFLSLALAAVAPAIAIAYLKPILMDILNDLCDGKRGAEFWIRAAYVLAITGTLLLMLSFGDFSNNWNVIEALRRVLLLVFLGVFATVTIIAANLWKQVQATIAARRADAAFAEKHSPAAEA